MHPVLFRFGWFSVYSFGFMLAVSFLLGIYLSTRRAQRFGIDPQHILDLSVYLIISGVVGSRLLYVAFHLGEYRNPVDVFALWQGGATLYGGFLLAVLAGYVFSKKRNIGFLLLGDIVSPAVVLGVALTRLGCFLSGCCYGRETGHGWGVVFPPDSPAGAYARQLAAGKAVETVALHPTQLYDSFLGLITFVLLLALQGKMVKRGAAFGLMMLCHGASRFVVDLFRYYEPNMRLDHAFNLNQIVSVALVAIGVFLLLRKTRDKTVRRAATKART
jgi:phosphatidylglycerol:prolipoprotein diacylglycerol transferase